MFRLNGIRYIALANINEFFSTAPNATTLKTWDTQGKANWEGRFHECSASHSVLHTEVIFMKVFKF